MQIEPLAVVMVAIGLVGWLAGPSFLIGAFFVSTLLGSAAAVTLTSLGSANIQPAYLMLGFVALYAVAQGRLRSATLASLAFPKDGFWLASTALYPVLSSAFL